MLTYPFISTLETKSRKNQISIQDDRFGFCSQKSELGIQLRKEHYDEVMLLLNTNGEKLQIDTREWIVLCAFIERFMFEQTKGN